MTGLLLSAPTIYADVLTCHFTEPYFTVVHDTESATVKVSGLQRSTEIFEGIGLQLQGVNRLLLAWQEHRLALVINYRGSDQMSDTIYPIAALWQRSAEHRGQTGGCSTEHLSMIMPEV